MSYYPPSGPPPPPGQYPTPPPPPPGYSQQSYGGYQPPYYAPNLAARYGFQYAGFWERFGASLLDGIFTSLMSLPFAAIGIALVAFNWDTRLGTCTDADGRRYTCDVPTGETIAYIALAFGIYFIAAIAITIWYWGTYEGKRTQTIGKRMLNIRTVRASTGQPIGFGRAVGRMFARYISGQLCYLGYLWMLWDTDKQTWHDKIVDSIVVKA